MSQTHVWLSLCPEATYLTIPYVKLTNSIFQVNMKPNKMSLRPGRYWYTVVLLKDHTCVCVNISTEFDIECGVFEGWSEVKKKKYAHLKVIWSRPKFWFIWLMCTSEIYLGPLVKMVCSGSQLLAYRVYAILCYSRFPCQQVYLHRYN